MKRFQRRRLTPLAGGLAGTSMPKSRRRRPEQEGTDMREQDRGAFRELMRRASELTVMPGGKDLGRTTEALFDALGPYPFGAVAEAVAAYCRSERFFPMLSDIVTHIEGKVGERAALAWAAVLRAVRRYGHYESVRFAEPATHWAVVQMGGWRKLSAGLTDDNERFVARDFERLYALGERAAAAGAVIPDHLAGEHEALNPGRPLGVWSRDEPASKAALAGGGAAG